MKSDLSNLMKQAQQLQSNFEKAQQDLANLQVTGEAGGGMVKIVMSGRHDVHRVSIDDSLVGEDKDMLEDLVAAAINDAVQKVEKDSKAKLSSVAGGLELPSGFKMPF